MRSPSEAEQDRPPRSCPRWHGGTGECVRRGAVSVESHCDVALLLLLLLLLLVCWSMETLDTFLRAKRS